MKELEAIKERLSAITPGPWELAGGNEWLSPLGIDVGHEDESARPTLAYRDAEFIAHAPETQAKLIAALEAVGKLASSAPRMVTFTGATVSGNVVADDILKAIDEALA